MSSLYPIGFVLPYAGSFTSTSEAALIAAGYLPCDGRALSQSDPQYADLFGQIATFYGGTSTTFCVPDYRGLFLRGTDNGAGVDPNAATRTAPQPTLQFPGNTGDNVGSMQPGGLQGHAHEYASSGGDYHLIDYGGLETPGVFAENNTTTAASGATGGSETRPRNAYINYVIVYM
jgi:microcystin-dependent protein